MEPLSRVGRNQVYGTLFLFFGAYLLVPFEPRLQVLLPPVELDSTELLTRIVVLASGGFFAGLLLEHLVGILGLRVTRFVCESARTDFTRHDLMEGAANLDTILREEPVLSSAIRGKPPLARFMAVAKYLSQERFKDFPELSPLRNFELSVTFSMASTVFAGLVAVGAVAALVQGAAYLGEGRLVVLGLCSILAVLLWSDAQKHYDGGRESTLVSMRERRAEADKAIREAADRERAAKEAQSATKTEEEARRLRLEGLSRDISAAVAEIDDKSPSKRMVAVANLGNVVTRPPFLLDAPGQAFENFVAAVRLARNLYERGDGDALDGHLRTIRNVLRSTQSLTLYKTVEKEITGLLVEIISRQPLDSVYFNKALLLAQDLQSAELADAILNRAIKEDPENSLPRLMFEDTLGGSALGYYNKDRIAAAIKAAPLFGENRRLRAAVTSILGSLANPESHKQNWPKVVQMEK